MVTPLMLGDPIDVEWLDISTYLGSFDLTDAKKKQLAHMRSRGFFLTYEVQGEIEILIMAATRDSDEDSQFLDITVIPANLIQKIKIDG